MAMELERQREVGQRIKELRGPKPQRVIADAVPVTLRAYGAWEAGDSGIAWDNLQRLAEIFGVTENYILYGEEEVRGPQSQLDRIEAKLEALSKTVGAGAVLLALLVDWSEEDLPQDGAQALAEVRGTQAVGDRRG